MNVKQQLFNYIQEIYHLRNLKNILYWDLLKQTPKAAREYRLKELDDLNKDIQERFLDKKLGSLIVKAEEENIGEQKWDKANFLLIKEKFTEEEKIPGKLASSFSQVSSITEQKWIKAKKENNFHLVNDSFSELIGLAKEIAKYSNSGNYYEYYLQKYDQGRTYQEVDLMMSLLKPQIKNLLHNFSKRETKRAEDYEFKINKKMPINWLKFWALTCLAVE
jgi:Zn-dependent M32 family carboxypeptidase